MVFDCVLYRDEIDALTIRLHELDRVVDVFVIVEANVTFSGQPRDIGFNPGDPRLAPFADRIRHVIVADMPATRDPWQREAWQRNAVLRGVPDAGPDDLLILSDVDEIPRATVIEEIVNDTENSAFGLELGFFYFFVNYRNTAGPEAAITWTVVCRRDRLDDISANDLRYAVRDRKVPARVVGNAGWHFSYLMDEAGLRRKIASFSHQEFNTPEFLDRVDIAGLVKKGGDLFDRPGFVWALCDASDLPRWLQAQRRSLDHLFAPAGWRTPLLSGLNRLAGAVRRRRTTPPPVVVCPYLFDHEKDEITRKFRLDTRAGAKLDFFAWQDHDRIGPERAFEACWSRFPARDIIIVHSDMAPCPGESPHGWYEQLLDYRARMPAAGMMGCNLFYPRDRSGAPAHVQCAGGTFLNGQISYIHGEVRTGPDQADGVAEADLRVVRPVDWVTFGGVLIRREVIRACGSFDRRYQWAYVMDVDYSFEARLRGFRLVQVPVSLQHEESRTTRKLWTEQPALLSHFTANMALFQKKWAPFLPALPSEEAILAGSPADRGKTP